MGPNAPTPAPFVNGDAFLITLDQDCSIFSASAVSNLVSYFYDITPVTFSTRCASTLLSFFCSGITKDAANAYCQKIYTDIMTPGSQLYQLLKPITSAPAASSTASGTSDKGLYGLFALILIPVALIVVAVMWYYRKKQLKEIEEKHKNNPLREIEKDDETYIPSAVPQAAQPPSRPKSPPPLPVSSPVLPLKNVPIISFGGNPPVPLAGLGEETLVIPVITPPMQTANWQIPHKEVPPTAPSAASRVIPPTVSPITTATPATMTALQKELVHPPALASTPSPHDANWAVPVPQQHLSLHGVNWAIPIPNNELYSSNWKALPSTCGPTPVPTPTSPHNTLSVTATSKS
jgi:hypothetical protein